ncbi:hypothetical protein ASAP_1822 [Asaia bogorensis]|uniref:Uncharacterized protein n=1 Tax=Asaia bogorensis TaxID=91915 RepID=A0A060QKY8_9PROT|nr:hypothetical protein ASAP_1822 [Asaia bogorensis]
MGVISFGLLCFSLCHDHCTQGETLRQSMRMGYAALRR